MQLVEQGKLSLEDPINNRLSPPLQVPDEGFQKPDPRAPSDDSQPVSRI